MSDFWDRKGLNATFVATPVAQQQLEEGVREMQESIENLETTNVFEEEEEDIAETMNDCNLRLEMGRLYQMVLQGDIFAETNADPKAIRNVHRKIRKFVQQEMEIMLGVRAETVTQNVVVAHQFNDLQVTVLKMLAAKMSGGETEKVESKIPEQQAPTAPPKKDGISSISGTVSYKNPAPLASPKKEVKSAIKPQHKPVQPQKSALPTTEGSALQKNVDDMTPQELASYDEAAIARRTKNRAATPANLVPHPSSQQLEQMYVMRAQNMPIKHVLPQN